MKKRLLLLMSAMMLWGMGFAQIPEGYVDVYQIQSITAAGDATDKTGEVAALASVQLLGNSAGWGEALRYDVTNYEELVVKLSSADNDGKQIVLRFSANGVAYLLKTTFLGTTAEFKINLGDYRDASGKVVLGGIFFYNGADNAWGASWYDGAKPEASTTVDYVALKTIGVEGVSVAAADAPIAAALPIGQSTALNAVFTPINATNQNVTWSSGAPAIATVDASGVVTGVAVGTATITATTEDGSFSDTYEVTVVAEAVSVANVSLNLSALEMKKPMTSTIFATVLPAIAANKAVTWSSSNPAVATVTDGVITAVSAGTTTITVTTEDGGLTDECVVTVNEFASVPEGYVSIYPLQSRTGLGDNEDPVDESKMVVETYTELASAKVEIEANKFLLGPGGGWGKAWKNYCDLSEYSELKIRLSYDYVDGGRQCVLRVANATGATAAATTPILIDLPEGQTTYEFVVDLSKYSFTDNGTRKVYIGGLVFYTGEHAYGGTPYTKARVTKPVYIDYVAANLGTEVRVAAEADAYGTICLPMNASVTNATIYNVAGVDSKTAPTKLYLEEATGNLVAGVPYIYKATAAGNVEFAYTGTTKTVTADSAKGLVGNLIKQRVADGMYVLGTGYKWYSTEDSFVSGRYRAYLNLADENLPVLDSAPVGARVVDFYNDPTGIQTTEASDTLVDVYSIQGIKIRAQVKSSDALNGLQKGIYVVNGKKVTVL